MKTVHVKITGKVQGVWFRASTKQEAEKHGVYGWVRNTTDGGVEAIFQGDSKKVQSLLEWCKQGPPVAKVEQVFVEDIDSNEQYSIFSVRY